MTSTHPSVSEQTRRGVLRQGRCGANEAEMVGMLGRAQSRSASDAQVYVSVPMRGSAGQSTPDCRYLDSVGLTNVSIADRENDTAVHEEARKRRMMPLIPYDIAARDETAHGGVEHR